MKHGTVWKRTPLATVVPTALDLHWAAGLLEGEGCFSRLKNSEKVDCGMTTPEPVKRLQDLFGGSFRPYRQKSNSFGTKDMYLWTTCGSRARGVMFTLYRLLSPRRQQQIRRAIHFEKAQT